MSFALLGGALGGLGLFLLGMRLMTGGLKVTAGGLLRDLLSRWTRTRLRGLASGFMITGIVQSSSAVTVATIGFVNAGLLTLGQAMWVIFGSNVGTTMTGWIVALLGFDIRIEAFALPLLGIGMFLTLTGGSTRRNALGEALAGFGLFFLGIATLKATFGELGGAIDVSAFVGHGVLLAVVYVALGFVLTTLFQSSSAVMAIALTAAGTGMLPLEPSAALVIGANIGTTSTALLAVIEATPNARRVAVSHVAFNLLTGVAALALLPLMLLGVQTFERSLGLAAGPATTLALFHTVFNLLGVALIWPISGRLERWLAGRFRTEEEDRGRPRHLDSNSLAVPALAIGSIGLELGRVADMSLGIARGALSVPAVSADSLARQGESVRSLNEAVIRYIQDFGASRTSERIAGAMTHPIRALWHYVESAELAADIARWRRDPVALPASSRNQIDNYVTLAATAVDRYREHPEAALAPDTAETLETVYQRTKGDILVGASRGQIAPAQAETALELLSAIKTQLRHLDRAAGRLRALAAALDEDEDVAPPEPPAAEDAATREAPAEPAP